MTLKSNESRLLPYWLLFSVFVSGAILNPSTRRSIAGVNPIMLAGGLLIVLMIGLRFHVGADWYAYERMYYRASWLDFHEALADGDPGYSALNWLAHALGLQIWAVNLVCAIIFTWGLLRFVSKQSNPWLTLVVAIPYLVIVVAMGYSRQAVAIGVIMAGLARLDRMPIWQFAIYAFVAVLFHKSAVIVLPLVALATQQSKLVTGAMMAVTAVGLYYLFVQNAMDTLMAVYIENEYEAEGAQIRVLMNIIPAALFLIFNKRFDLSEQERKLWRNFSYAAFVTLAALFLIAGSTAVDRVALYLIPLQLMVYGNLPDALARAGTNRALRVGVILYSAAVLYVWLNFAEHSRDWIPYEIFPFSSQQALLPPPE